MEPEKQPFEKPYPLKYRGYSDPMVIGAGALVLGFAIGSGRWNWLGNEAKKIAGSIGNLMLLSVYDAFRDKNPSLFGEKARITH